MRPFKRLFPFCTYDSIATMAAFLPFPAIIWSSNQNARPETFCERSTDKKTFSPTKSTTRILTRHEMFLAALTNTWKQVSWTFHPHILPSII